MSELSMNDKMTLVQYAIEKYENEEELLSKLSSVLPEKDIQILEKNQRMHNKVRRTIDASGAIQFKNELFSITKKR